MVGRFATETAKPILVVMTTSTTETYDVRFYADEARIALGVN